MKCDEDILIKRINKFVSFMNTKHGELSAGFVANIDKIIVNLKAYEVVYPTLVEITDLVYWAERHSEIKEVEVKFKYLAEHFWD